MPILALLLALTPGERLAELFAEAHPVEGSLFVRMARVAPDVGACEQAPDSALRPWATGLPQ